MLLRFAGDDVLVIVDRDARAIDLEDGREIELDLPADRVIDLAGSGSPLGPSGLT